MLDKISIYQINLDQRQDRWVESLANHKAMGFDHYDIKRFPAVLQPENGALGCAKSHLKALTAFLTDDAQEYCLILEDDFDFSVTAEEFQQKLDAIKAANVNWDVLLLSATFLLSFPTSLPFLSRAFESHTTAGYIVRRSYLPTLLACVAESVSNLERFKNMEPAHAFRDRFALDRYWQRLQHNGQGWYVFTPNVGIQRPSFSDIEGKFVDYKDVHTK